MNRLLALIARSRLILIAAEMRHNLAIKQASTYKDTCP